MSNEPDTLVIVSCDALFALDVITWAETRGATYSVYTGNALAELRSGNPAMMREALFGAEPGEAVRSRRELTSTGAADREPGMLRPGTINAAKDSIRKQGPCAFSGGLYARHRLIDAQLGRMAAGDTPESVAGDYGATVAHMMADAAALVDLLNEATIATCPSEASPAERKPTAVLGEERGDEPVPKSPSPSSPPESR